MPARGSGWWSQAGSNRRPLACHASALPAELWPHAKPAQPTQRRRCCQASQPQHEPSLNSLAPLEFMPTPSLGGTVPIRNDAMSADPTSTLRILQAASSAGAAGRSREAEELLARAAQLAPDHPAVLNQRGLQLMQR